MTNTTPMLETNSESNTDSASHYLYAVVDHDQKIPKLLNEGIDKKNIYTINRGRLVAIVSDIENRRLRPERRNLAAHNKVLNELMKYGTPLPVSFGVVADDREALERLLDDYQEEFISQLDLVHNQMEMALKISWKVDNIFDYFVTTHPELKRARDEVFERSLTPDREEKIELGRYFNSLHGQQREIYVSAVNEILAPYCKEIIDNKCKDERQVLEFSCLIDRNKESEFDQAIEQASNIFDDNYVLEYNGPFVPFSFVKLDLT